jgi:hypothetical protein
MIGNLVKLENFFMNRPIRVYEASGNTHVVYILQGCPCIGSDAYPFTAQKSPQPKLFFLIQFQTIFL